MLPNPVFPAPSQNESCILPPKMTSSTFAPSSSSPSPTPTVAAAASATADDLRDHAMDLTTRGSKRPLGGAAPESDSNVAAMIAAAEALDAQISSSYTKKRGSISGLHRNGELERSSAFKPVVKSEPRTSGSGAGSSSSAGSSSGGAGLMKLKPEPFNQGEAAQR